MDGVQFEITNTNKELSQPFYGYNQKEMAIKPCSCADYVLVKQNVKVSEISLMHNNHLVNQYRSIKMISREREKSGYTSFSY